MSWAQLAAIIADAQRGGAAEETSESTFCPVDGTVLVTNGDGVAGCRFCGWRSDQQSDHGDFP